MRPLQYILTLTSMILISTSQVLAGNSSGGGGFFLGDSINPWFVQNKKNVTYCIEHDPNTFSAERDVVLPLVKEAFAYWKLEFKSAFTPIALGSEAIVIATQNFTLVDCQEEDVSIKFQFGVTTDSQRKIIKGTENTVIGLTYREQYDRVNLSGKGFIYIAPDKGPERLIGEDFVSTPWSLGKSGLLYRVLVHELGHVFGIPHSGGNDQLMSHGFPEFLLHSSRAANLASTFTLPSFFSFKGSLIEKVCVKKFSDAVVRALGLHPDTMCLGFVSDDSRTIHVSACIGPICRNTMDPIGAIRVAMEGNIKHESVIDFYLPYEQEVFPKVPMPFGRVVDGPARSVSIVDGVFENLSRSKILPVKLSLDPSKVKTVTSFDRFHFGVVPSISTVSEGKIISDLLTGY